MFTSSCRNERRTRQGFDRTALIKTSTTRRATSNAAITMSGWAGKQVPSFDVTMVSSNGTIGAKMPLSAMLGKPLVIHLYNGG